jgi:hypothetical protein
MHNATTPHITALLTLSDVLDVGEGAALGEALGRHGVRAGHGRGVEHAVRDRRDTAHGGC